MSKVSAPSSNGRFDLPSTLKRGRPAYRSTRRTRGKQKQSICAPNRPWRSNGFAEWRSLARRLYRTSLSKWLSHAYIHYMGKSMSLTRCAYHSALKFASKALRRTTSLLHHFPRPPAAAIPNLSYSSWLVQRESDSRSRLLTRRHGRFRLWGLKTRRLNSRGTSSFRNGHRYANGRWSASHRLLSHGGRRPQSVR